MTFYYFHLFGEYFQQMPIYMNEKTQAKLTAHIQCDVVAQRRFRRRMGHFAGEPLVVIIRA